MKNLVSFFSSLIHSDKAANDNNLPEFEIRQAIRDLRALSDRDLNDMGLSRSDIEYAVRNGRRGIDDRHAA